jgi:hypothetical protein
MKSNCAKASKCDSARFCQDGQFLRKPCPSYDQFKRMKWQGSTDGITWHDVPLSEVFPVKAKKGKRK